MWKNEKDRATSSKQLAEQFRKVFEKTLIDKDIESLETIISQLKQIKQVWEFEQEIKEIALEMPFEEYGKVSNQPKNRKEKN